jgi:hypothetical protein
MNGATTQNPNLKKISLALVSVLQMERLSLSETAAAMEMRVFILGTGKISCAMHMRALGNLK